MQALHTMRRVFLVLIKRGDVRRPAKAGAPKEGSNKRPRGEAAAPATEAEAAAAEAAAEAALRVFQGWVYDQYQALVGALLGLLDAPALRVKVAALRTLMELVNVESQVRRKPQRCFGQDLFHRLVGRLVQAPAGPGGLHDEVVAVLKVDYVEPFFDVRYWLLRSLRVLAAKLSSAQGAENGGQAQRCAMVAAMFKLLMLVTAPKTEPEIISFFVPFVDEEAAAYQQQQGEGEGEGEEGAGDEDDDALDFDYGDGDADGGDGDEADEAATGASSSSSKAAGVPLVARLSAHRKALGEAWVACLRLELTPALYRSTTQFVARHVVDAMLSPLQVRC